MCVSECVCVSLSVCVCVCVGREAWEVEEAEAESEQEWLATCDLPRVMDLRSEGCLGDCVLKWVCLETQ